MVVKSGQTATLSRTEYIMELLELGFSNIEICEITGLNRNQVAGIKFRFTNPIEGNKNAN